MQESAQAQRERYAALQRKLEHLEKIHADEKKQVRVSIYFVALWSPDTWIASGQPGQRHERALSRTKK